jgi:hypothetical protein
VPRIRTLVPNVTREQALTKFTSRMTGARVLNLVHGPLHSVTDFYIPFQFFRVVIVGRAEEQPRLLGIDSVTAELDLYEFEDLPESEDVQYIETRKCPEVLLDEPRARELLIRKVRRRVLAGEFLHLRKLNIAAEAVAGEIYIPYWIGFRGHGLRARFDIIDAMRQCVEGGKLRRLLRQWLRSVAVNG